MRRLGSAAIVSLGLWSGTLALAEDGPVDLDAVDTGQMRSLDSYDTGRTRSLDSVDTGSTVDFDSVDTGTTESLSAAEAAPAAAPSPPAPLPPIANDSLREKALAAHAELAAAEHRSVAANAAYSEMRAHDFPRGDAAAAIVKEYQTARDTYDQAKAQYTEILEQVNPAAIGN